MFRQSPSRNQKNKGLRAKHVLQITLLIGVCVWLLYQVKHSRDKRNALVSMNGRVSDKMEESVDGIFRFGRKDIRSGIHMVSDKPKEDPEEEEEEGVKHVEEKGDSADIIKGENQDSTNDDVEQEEEFMDGGVEETKNKGGKENEVDDNRASEEEPGNGDGDTGPHDEESVSNGLTRDTQMIKSDVGDSQQEKENEHMEVPNNPEHKNEKEEGDITSSQWTATEEATVEETELKSSSSEVSQVLNENEIVDDPLLNGTNTVEPGGVKLSENMTVSDMNIQTESRDLNTTSWESRDKNTTLSEIQEQGTISAEWQDQNTILSESQDRSSTLSESQNQISTLSKSQDQNTSFAKVEDEKASFSESQDQNNSSMQETHDQNTTLTESLDENATLAAEPQDRNTTLLESTDQNTTAVELQGENTTLSYTQDQNANLSVEQKEKSDADSESREEGEHSESEVASEAVHIDEHNPSDSLATQEERDALTDLGTLPQHDGEDTEAKAVAAE